MKKSVEQIFEKMANDSLDSLEQISYAESNVIQEDYKNRYFFEIIQNCRDSNVLLKSKGKVRFELSENVLYVGNTGQQFTRDGIYAISRIGKSEKRSLEFIGHKGIGFISILEITTLPTIVTKDGSVFFDKELTKKKLLERREDIQAMPTKNIPLFAFPHFDSLTVEDYSFSDYDTLLVLPLKDGISEEKVFDLFKRLICPEQLILLGNLEHIEFVWGEKHISYTISHTNNRIKVCSKVDLYEDVLSYTYFSETFVLEEDAFIGLSEREKEIYSSKTIDFAIAIKTNESGKFIPVNDCQFYLYYPTEHSVSGFNFIIHSNFSVDPGRKGLQDNILNKTILREIGKVMSEDRKGSFLHYLKKNHKEDLLSILAFNRVHSNVNDSLYDSLVEGLSKVDFLPYAKSFYGIEEVIIGDRYDEEFFSLKVLGQRTVICFPEKVYKWLESEFSPLLFSPDHATTLLENSIEENGCSVEYLNRIYEYLLKFDINFRDCKALLTVNDDLVCGAETDVFFHVEKDSFEVHSLPTALKGRITLLHRDIVIDSPKQFMQCSGARMLNLDEIVDKLLSIQKNEPEHSSTILRYVFELYNQNKLINKVLDRVKKELHLPVKNGWKNQEEAILCFDHNGFSKLYPDQVYIDLSPINWVNQNISGFKSFLKTLKVWFYPVVFRKDNNDIKINEPVTFNDDFYALILSNWRTIRNHSPGSYNFKFENSYLLRYLNTNNWIPSNSGYHNPRYVVCINEKSFSPKEISLLSSYLPVLVLDGEDNKEFIADFELIHLDKLTFNCCIRLLKIIFEFYKENPLDESFKAFYNFILSSIVFRFYEVNESLQPELIEELRKVSLLGMKNGNLIWSVASELLYVDKVKLLSKLPQNVSSVLPAEFTRRSSIEFGRIAREVGKPLTELVSISFIADYDIQVTKLSDWIPNQAILASVLEKRLGRKLEPGHLETLSGTEIAFQYEILITAKVFDKSFQYEEDHFVSVKENRVYLKSRSFAKISKGLKELFAEIFKRDLDDFDLRIASLLQSIKHQKEKEFCEENEIDEDSISSYNQEIALDSNHVAKQIKRISPVESIEVSEMQVRTVDIDTESIIESVDIPGIKVSIDTSAYVDTDNLDHQPIKGRGYRNKPYEAKLSNLSAHKIGMLAERIVYKKLIEDPGLLATALNNCSEDFRSIEVDWFNESQVGCTYSEFQDQSVGRGCDMIWKTSVGDYFIEVKGKTSGSIETYLTYPELKLMKEKKEFSLLVIVNEVEKAALIPPRIQVIQAPFKRLIGLNDYYISQFAFR